MWLVAEFSPIAENFTPTAPDVSWESALTTPVPGYVDTDVSGSFSNGQSEEPYAFPSVAGAAVSVEQSLSKISFVQGTSGQMSSSIAYIRYWSRRGTQQKTSVGDNPVNGAVSDPQDALLSQINTLSYGTSLNLVPVTQSTPQTGPALAIPTNTAYQSRPRQPVPTGTRSTTPPPPNRLGSIFSANPGGATAPAWANPFSSRPASPSPDNAVWQFLFNPEELQLSSGPDFNRGETWGVSDPANSGQPLSWRSNKNRKLTFGKVLLHGYTFGRRVDSLEKGLQELFLARDGENGADGPPVLEFVWGERVFGPCVIQNIQVREKAWDKGLLVNAEVSFDLEQVPEWTINDGFVDVLRPGRQSMVNDPTVVSNEYKGTEAGETGTNTLPPATKPGGGGGQQPDDLNLREVKECERTKELYGGFKKLEEKAIKESKSKSNSDISVARQRRNIQMYVKEYESLWLKAQRYGLVKILDPLITTPVSPKVLQDNVNNAIDRIKKDTPGGLFGSYPDYRDAAKLVVSVVNSYKIASDKYSKSQKCKRAFDQISQSRKRAEKENKKAEEEAKCKSRSLGAKCSGFASTTTCGSGIRLKCDGSTYQRFNK